MFSLRVGHGLACMKSRASSLSHARRFLSVRATVAPECAAVDASSAHADRMAQVMDIHSSTGHQNAASLLRTPLLEPRFWTGEQAVDEALFTLDFAGRGLPDIASELAAEGSAAVPQDVREQIQETYDRAGIVLARNTGLDDNLAAMRALSQVILTETMEYDGGSNSRGEILSNVFETGAPAVAWLHYHHEMAYVGRSTRQISFACTAAVGDGKATGATFVSEAIGHTNALMATPLGPKLRDLGICYVRCLPDRDTGLSDSITADDSPVYNFWQNSFGVETVAEAEAEANKQGLEFEWGPNRFLRTKYYVDAFEYCPRLDRNLLYAAVADDSIWFDTWPGVMHLPTMDDPSTSHEYDRPLKITFGDGSDFTREELHTLIDVYDQHGVRIDWRAGDVAIMCNHQWAHGRPGYTLLPGQRRELAVMLGKTYERVGQLDGKGP